MKAQNTTLECLECCQYPAKDYQSNIHDWVCKLLNKLVIPGAEYISRIK